MKTIYGVTNKEHFDYASWWNDVQNGSFQHRDR